MARFIPSPRYLLLDHIAIRAQCDPAPHMAESLLINLRIRLFPRISSAGGLARTSHYLQASSLKPMEAMRVTGLATSETKNDVYVNLCLLHCSIVPKSSQDDISIVPRIARCLSDRREHLTFHG
jgi:hypothetical protein